MGTDNSQERTPVKLNDDTPQPTCACDGIGHVRRIRVASSQSGIPMFQHQSIELFNSNLQYAGAISTCCNIDREKTWIRSGCRCLLWIPAGLGLGTKTSNKSTDGKQVRGLTHGPSKRGAAMALLGLHRLKAGPTALPPPSRLQVFLPPNRRRLAVLRTPGHAQGLREPGPFSGPG